MTDLTGKRVRFLTEVPALAEAVVVADLEHGYVLRIDPKTIEPVPDSRGPGVVALYTDGTYANLTIDNPGDPNLTWLGKAHATNIQEVLP
jgi:hypothetical protein